MNWKKSQCIAEKFAFFKFPIMEIIFLLIAYFVFVVVLFIICFNYFLLISFNFSYQKKFFLFIYFLLN